ncbi:DUF995 domain-containing protein [Mesorhizobium sp. KR1-2]|uniref:DUF995 domain-containing protein n=1 Tax=Mesorhizobium sp. KR1-2 TaxID=3156609 RepID=UPI0032B3FE5F
MHTGMQWLKLSAFVLAFAPSVALSDPLPKGAVPLTADEVHAMYSGKSSNWSESRAYFAPDGTYLIFGKDKKWYGEGKWAVDGNKICANLTWKAAGGKTGKADDCWTWYHNGSKYMTLWSGDKDKKNAYAAGESKKLTAGDKVSAPFNDIKKKIGA